MADDDGLFIMDGIQTFVPTETESVPPDFRSNVSSYPQANHFQQVAPFSGFHQSLIRSYAGNNEPVRPFDITHQTMVRPTFSQQSFIRPSPLTQQPVVRPSPVYQQPLMRPQNFQQSLILLSQNYKQPLIESSNQHFPQPVITSQSYDSSVRPTMMNHGEHLRQSNQYAAQPVRPKETLCLSGMAPQQASNSKSLENGIEEDERTLSPPINFINVDSMNEPSKDDAARSSQPQQVQQRLGNLNPNIPLAVPISSSDGIQSYLLYEPMNKIAMSQEPISSNSQVSCIVSSSAAPFSDTNTRLEFTGHRKTFPEVTGSQEIMRPAHIENTAGKNAVDVGSSRISLKEKLKDVRKSSVTITALTVHPTKDTPFHHAQEQSRITNSSKTAVSAEPDPNKLVTHSAPCTSQNLSPAGITLHTTNFNIKNISGMEEKSGNNDAANHEQPVRPSSTPIAVNSIHPPSKSLCDNKIGNLSSKGISGSQDLLDRKRTNNFRTGNVKELRELKDIKLNCNSEVKMLSNLRVVLTSLDIVDGSKHKAVVTSASNEAKEKGLADGRSYGSVSERTERKTTSSDGSKEKPNTSLNGTKEKNTSLDGSKGKERSSSSLDGTKERTKSFAARRSLVNQKNGGKSSADKNDTDVTFVQERDLREKTRNQVALTVEDSDSDICIVDEEIKNPEALKRKGKLALKSQMAYLKRLQSKILKCSECNFKTMSLSQLKEHEEMHPKGRKLKCSKCPFETRIKSCMVYHSVIHAGGKKFRCSKCPFKTDVLEKFLEHEAKKLLCPKCKTDCHTQKDLNKHIFESHGVGRFLCDVCNFTTRSVESMKAHTHKEKEKSPPSNVKRLKGAESSSSARKREEEPSSKVKKLKNFSSDERYVCTECYYTAPSLIILKEHVQLTHKDIENVEIKRKRRRGRPKRTGGGTKHTQESTKNYEKEIDFSKYQTTFGEYLCPKCRYVSDEKLFFENHLKSHVSDDVTMFAKPAEIFKCSFCEFETEFEKMIESHLLTHTEHDSDFDGDDTAKNNDDNNVFDDDINFLEFVENKKYQCSVCDYQTDFLRAFKTHGSLHMRKDVFNIIFSSLF